MHDGGKGQQDGQSGKAGVAESVESFWTGTGKAESWKRKVSG